MGRLERAMAIGRRDAITRRFGIDVRALAAFRVSLGLLLLADLALRSRSLIAFYTDDGVLPRSVLTEQFPSVYRLSLHTVSGGAWAQVLLFSLAAACAVALVVGYRTRLATAGSLLLLVSLHARNPLVLNGGDALLWRLVLWGGFLPLGERWSVDARHRDRARRRVTSVASAGLLVHVVLVYVVNVAVKLRGNRWLRGEAVRYVFSLDQFTVLFGDVLAGYPPVLVAINWLWLGMLLGAALLILLTGRARTLFVALFASVHLGMLLTMRLGLFPLVSITALLVFLPASVWDALSDRLGMFGAANQWSDGRDGTSARLLVASVTSLVGQWFDRFREPAAVLLLCVVLVWNAAALGVVHSPDGIPVDPGDGTWNMFAPEPVATDVWFVAPGRLESGRQIDALRRSSLRWDRPPDLAATYPTARWRKYLTNLRRSRYAVYRPGLADHLCWRWNRRHEDELVAVRIVAVEEPTRLGESEPTRRVGLGNYSCPR